MSDTQRTIDTMTILKNWNWFVKIILVAVFAVVRISKAVEKGNRTT